MQDYFGINKYYLGERMKTLMLLTLIFKGLWAGFERHCFTIVNVRRYATEDFYSCHNLVTVYSVARCSVKNKNGVIKYLIVDELAELHTAHYINQLEPQKPRTLVSIQSVNLADLSLVCGPAVEPDDIKVSLVNNLGRRVSGVMAVTINGANRELRKLKESRPLSVYQIEAQFGLATENHWHDGKVWEKSTYSHLHKPKIDQILSSIEASNQRKMFEYCGVDSSSQAAYEMAVQGLLRPAIKSPTIVYGIKCIHFEPPNFTLELHCINETEAYLTTLVHDFGIALKTNAVCSKIRCIRYGHLTVRDALLRSQWKLQDLYDNMYQCGNVLRAMPDTTPKLTSQGDKAGIR
nr:EOG090X0AGI [Leptodora kindtii]